MATHVFTVFEVDRSYYFTDAASPILGRSTLTVSDADGQLDRRVVSDVGRDQEFSFAGEPRVDSYDITFLDFAQVNGAGPEFELYAMQVGFEDGATKFYVLSKDQGFAPEIGDDLAVTNFSIFSSVDYIDLPPPICFTPGALILTPGGGVPVERLGPGDLVQTMDNGPQPILWVGRRDLGPADLRRQENLRPVEVKAGALGNDRPLLVSPQHRLLTKFGGEERFIRAKHLAEVPGGGARIARGKRHVSYLHLLLERHEVIFAEGAATESLMLGPIALSGISRADRAELAALFPELLADRPPEYALARPVLRRRDLASFAGAGGGRGPMLPPPAELPGARSYSVSPNGAAPPPG
ncbi:MAG: Hint domain-containing protein [Pseudomonadota bacterium]